MSMILLLAALIAGSIVFSVAERRHTRRKRARRFAGDYPDWSEVTYNLSRLSLIRGYWQARVEAGPPDHPIDAITWDDLDMDRVFSAMNACVSAPGEEMLYTRLRRTSFDPEEISRFRRATDLFAGRPETRRQVLAILDGISSPLDGQGFALLFHPEEQGVGNIRKYTLLSLLIFLAVPVWFLLSPAAALYLFIGAICANVLTYFTDKAAFSTRMEAVNYLHSVICAAEALADLDFEGHAWGEIFRESLAPLGEVKRRCARNLFVSRELGALRVVGAWEYLFFHRAVEAIARHGAELRTLYEAVGALDAALAVGAYRRTLPVSCDPDFTGGRDILLEGLYHPLVKNPVRNTIRLDKNALVTGSNASGKSTFIKAVAISMITAQTLGLCFAERHRGAMHKVMASMAIRDQIASGDSYFIMEMKSLKRMLAELNDGYPLACFVDEILKGTNTVERISASASILQWLDGENCRVMVASHDIELTEMLGGLYANYHFKERLDGEAMVFDYTLYPGRADTRNAIRLLEQMDYDRAITGRAREITRAYAETGHWPVLGG